MPELLKIKGFCRLISLEDAVRPEDVPDILRLLHRSGMRAVLAAGVVRDLREGPNTITNYGHSHVAARLTGTSVTALGTSWYIAVGTGAGTTAVGDTVLFNEPGSGTFRKAVDTVYVSANTIQLSCTFSGSEAVGSLTEQGLFDASSSGNMWNHWQPTPASPFPHASGSMVAMTQITC